MKKSKVLLSLILTGSITLTGCSSEKKEEVSNNNSSTPTQTPVKKSNEAKLGEKLIFENEAEITIKKAEWTDERNSLEDTVAKKVLLVTYDTKNISEKEYSVGSDVELYVNGKKAQRYAVKLTVDTISPNRILENATQAFAVNEDGELELEVKPFLSQKPKKIIKLDLK